MLQIKQSSESELPLNHLDQNSLLETGGMAASGSFYGLLKTALNFFLKLFF